MWLRPANPAEEGQVPGSIPGQGVKQPLLDFVPPAAIPGASHLHVAPLETQAILSTSRTKSIPMVQGGLCVIYHVWGKKTHQGI